MTADSTTTDGPAQIAKAKAGHDAFQAWIGKQNIVVRGGVVLRSRRGSEMALAFPEIAAGAAQLPDATALDGELVVWDAAGRLKFERLQDRLARRGAGAARAAGEWLTTSSRSTWCGCPERIRPRGRTSSAGPRWNPFSPNGG